MKTAHRRPSGRDETEGWEDESWVVALVDPASGETESYGPYFRRQAEHLKGWWLARLRADRRHDVVVMIAPLRFTQPEPELLPD